MKCKVRSYRDFFLRRRAGTEVLRTYSKLDFQEIMIMVLGNNIYIGNIYIEVYILMIKVQ